MSDPQKTSSTESHDRASFRAGLRIANPPDPAQLAHERARLAAVEGESLPVRLRTYATMIGPGYLQSAMTLGGGTATTALFTGAVFGYSLQALLVGVHTLGFFKSLRRRGTVPLTGWRAAGRRASPWRS